MVPCPDCNQLCGIRDAVLLDDELYYRCAHCLTAFDVERQLRPEMLADERDVFDDELPPDETTPLVTPPYIRRGDPEELVARAPRAEDTPPLGALVAIASERLPTVQPPRGAHTHLPYVTPRTCLAPPPIPHEVRITRRERPLPLPPISPSPPPPPRHPTPLSFAVVEATPVVTTTSGRPVVFARRLVQGIFAGSAMVGLATTLAVLAAKAEPGASLVQRAVVEAPVPRLATARAEPAIELDDYPPVPTPISLSPIIMTTPPPPKPAPVRHANRSATEAETLAAEGDRAFREGKLDRAAALYNRALALSPTFVPARLGAAAVEWEHGDRESARARYRALSEENPRFLPVAVADRAH